MRRFITLCILCLWTAWSAEAQQNTDSAGTATDSSRFTISLITCGTGDDLYTLFGHTAIRVQDRLLHNDIVYNYGTFSFDDDFLKNFVLGNLRYWLAVEEFDQFVAFYRHTNRSVKEQVLNLTDSQATQIYRFLKNNAKEENKYYDYDFLYDNCATRVRDVFTTNLPYDFNYGNILKGQKVSFRQLLNQYLLHHHWTRLGINIVLGAKVDNPMKDEETMFIPDMLYTGAKGAVLGGDKWVQAEQEWVPEPPHEARTFNSPFWVLFLSFICTLAIFYVPKLSKLRPVVTVIGLLVTGLVGCLILFLWTCTRHHTATENWNILWALPTNLIILFFLRKPKEWMKLYALAAISCMLVSLVVHVIRMQHLPLNELIPLFGMLMFVYMNIYRMGLNQTILKQQAQTSTSE